MAFRPRRASPAIRPARCPGSSSITARCRSWNCTLIAPLAFDAPSGSGTKFGMGDTELGVKYRFVAEDADGWRRRSASFRWSSCRPPTPGAGSAPDTRSFFCRCGSRKASARGRPMAAAAIGTTPAPETGTTGSPAGSCSAKYGRARHRRRALPPDRRHGGRQRQHRLQSRRHLRFHGELPSPVFGRARARERDEDEPIFLLRRISVDVLIATGLAYNRARGGSHRPVLLSRIQFGG